MASRTITYQIPADRADGFLEALLGVGATTCSYPGPSMTIDEAKAAAETLTPTDIYRDVVRLPGHSLDADHRVGVQFLVPAGRFDDFANAVKAGVAHPGNDLLAAESCRFERTQVEDGRVGYAYLFTVWYKPQLP